LTYKKNANIITKGTNVLENKPFFDGQRNIVGTKILTGFGANKIK